MEKPLDTDVYLNAVEEFLKSRYYKSIIEEELSGTGTAPDIQVKQHDYCKTRDFLITISTIQNLRHSLEFCSFTLSEFSCSVRLEEGYIISIKHHKTSTGGE